MRILFLTQWFAPEPGAIRGLPLAKSLQQWDDEVEVLTGFPNYPGGRVYPGYRMRIWQREQVEGVPVLRVPLYPSHDSSAAGRILNYASFALSASALGLALARRAEVGYVYHPPPTVGFPAFLFKTLRRLPFVYHIADMWPESVTESGMIQGEIPRKIAHGMISGWCNFVYRQARAITVLSPGFKRLLVERGVPAEKVHIIYNWTDEDTFQPTPRDPEFARQFGLENTFNVVYAGNLGVFQGIDTIIRAAALVSDLPSVRIVIVGTGQKGQELKELTRNLSLRNVVFVGRRDYSQMPGIYGLADVLLVHLKDLPFFATTIPSKTQVSMACGRPTLMAVRGDSSDIIQRARCGLPCKPESPEAMARAIRDFFSMSVEKREEMGANGRAYYLDEMSLSCGTRQMRQLFSSMVYPHRKLGEAAHA
jgi:colanic acid biosynthesis glycosyl transferase WcaI